MASQLQMTFGERVRQRRNELGWTQTQLADKLGMKQSAISDIETGQHAPTLETVEKFAKKLGVKHDALLS